MLRYRTNQQRGAPGPAQRCEGAWREKAFRESCSRTRPGDEAVAAAIARWDMDGSDCEAPLAGAPDGDDLALSRSAGRRLCEHHQSAVAGPGHAREFQRDAGRHVGEMLPVACPWIEQPDVYDLRAAHVVRGVGEAQLHQLAARVYGRL